MHPKIVSLPRVATGFVWGFLATVCAAYGLFALAAGIGLIEANKVRTLPIAFQIHAIAGGIVLITGITQFNAMLRARLPWIHRISGRIYVASTLAAGAAAIVNAAFFDVGLAAKVSFFLLGLLWIGTTSIAYQEARKRRFLLHREWMLRSFALSLFFISFSLWVPAFAGNSSQHDTAYLVAVSLSWMLNLVAAEIWIRYTRKRQLA